MCRIAVVIILFPVLYSNPGLQKIPHSSSCRRCGITADFKEFLCRNIKHFNIAFYLFLEETVEPSTEPKAPAPAGIYGQSERVWLGV